MLKVLFTLLFSLHTTWALADCLNDTFNMLAWTSSFKQIFRADSGNTEQFWTVLDKGEQRKVVEWTLGYCELIETKSLHLTYNFRDLTEQISTEFKNWDQSQSDKLVVYQLSTVWLDHSSTGKRVLAPLLIDLLLKFMQQKGEHFSNERIKEILSRKFNGVIQSTRGDLALNSDNELLLNIFSHPKFMIPKLFHEMTHINKERKTLLAKDHFSYDDWIELTLFEEWRAIYWTNEFKKEWKGSFSIDKRSSLEQFESLLNITSGVVPEQKAAILDFKERWLEMSLDEKKTIIESAL